VSRHLDEAESDAARVSEAVEQVAMADSILLNKTDLVSVCGMINIGVKPAEQSQGVWGWRWGSG
jgi:hypothetical protein